MDIKKEIEKKIQEFVQELLKAELGLSIHKTILDGNGEDWRSYDAIAEITPVDKFLYRVFSLLSVRYQINFNKENGGYVLHRIWAHWDFFDGGSNGHELPFNNYKFDGEGNLLTQGRYEIFSRLAVGEQCESYRGTVQKTAPVLFPSGTVKYNSIVLSGEHKGEQYKVREAVVLVLPEKKRKDGAA